MPIYEFFCEDCNMIFNFLSARVNTSTMPPCPRCERVLRRQMSTFSTLGRAKEDDGMDDIMSSIDESQMERVLGELAHDAENINEDDPKQMARVMRKFSEKTGLNLGNGMEEALARMEAGEDPEKIEQEMGDVLEGEDPFAMGGKKGKKGSYRSQPVYDETLYEL